MNIMLSGYFIAVSALALLGFLSDFLVNEKVIYSLLLLGIAVSAVILIGMSWKLLKPGSKLKEQIKAKGKSPIIVALSLFIVVPLFTLPAFTKGLPVVLNTLSGKTGELVVTVQGKHSYYFAKNCFGRVNLQEFNFFTNDHVCGITEPDWKRLSSRDRLILIGKQSEFGMSYSQYRIISRSRF